MKIRVASHGGCKNDGKLAGLEVQRIAPAVFAVAPRDFIFADACRIGVDRILVVIDLDLPLRPARLVHACDRALAVLGRETNRWSGSAIGHCKNYYGHWPSRPKFHHCYCPLFSHSVEFLARPAMNEAQAIENLDRLTGIEIVSDQSVPARVPCAQGALLGEGTPQWHSFRHHNG